MGRCELARFESSETLAAAVAEGWLRDLQRVSAPSYSVALSGGRVAGKLFATLAQLPDTPELLRRVQFFWGDERYVPPSDPESNYHLADQQLLSPLGIPTAQIHRVRGELSPASAAAEAEAELRRHVPTDSTGWPVLDLVFLGMGEDGHVASLFPGEAEEVINSPKVYRAVMGPKPPPDRVTLGYGALAAARQVWVLASGPGKGGALEQSLGPNGKTPLARLLAMRDITHVYTDVPAG